MHYQQALGLVAVALTAVSFSYYVIAIRKGAMRPHVFSWVIWTLSTSVVFVAQVVAGGGAGAWATGVSAALTGYVTWLAWSRCRDITITRSDWWFLWAALGSLPLWYLSADPLWAVVILTTIDLLGFGPTLRKLYHHPYEESVLFYLLFVARSGLAILALDSLTLTTVLFPAAMMSSCLLVCVLLLWRRQQLAR